MSNTYFQFKQFRVEQGNCAMKVTTDACIQGAWTPVLPGVKNVLDIGTGTGLLALMLAQKNNEITIDAIEYDADAAAQAKENTGNSPWCERINVIEGDVRNYSFNIKYDLIITNPPFFSNSLLGDSANKNIARHTLSLSFTELFDAIACCLNDDGYLSILLPLDEYLQWQEIMSDAGWQELSVLYIKHTTNAPVKRVVGLFCRKEIEARNETTLVIKNGQELYTDEFVALLAPYYLNL
ncbi:MAG: methyltransferase protein [Flavipsychrobacter sp.]|jgi:tRNA1Val (adenine37-N6)-methyltransferase|nr:methyltransferase protein [Flavipsychrobacter sp.]